MGSDHEANAPKDGPQPDSAKSTAARLKDLLAEALDRPEADRRAFLEGACGRDRALFAEAESLLRAAEASGFLKSPTASFVADLPPSESAGGTIGPYKLLQQIGEGGFGAVFMAEQTEPIRRRVALKVIKLGMDTRQVVARFEQERQALAVMDHPNIAKVFDAGATASGRPYFVMELVKGQPITEYCDRQGLSVPERLELFSQVCHAVQHAHTKGVIHRDIKPRNVLVSTHDGKPLVKVIDFGIAKATDQRMTEKTLFTEHQAMIGTPEYMSPEQAEGSLDIDTRTDVYSLGVLLYELLTGATPFDGKSLREAGYGEICRIIREVDPPRPSVRVSTNAQAAWAKPAAANAESPSAERVGHLRKTDAAKLFGILKGDLDWVVMKALEKDRARRYATPTTLAEDVARYLAGDAVMAVPPSRWYRVRKFVRRNRVLVGAGLSILAIKAIAIVVIAVVAQVATRNAARADLARASEVAAKRSAQISGYASWLQTASLAIYHEQWNQADRALAKAISPEFSEDPAPVTEQHFEWNLIAVQRRESPRRLASSLYPIAISPDCRLILAEAGWTDDQSDETGRSLFLVDSETFGIRKTLIAPFHGDWRNCSGFSPDGQSVWAIGESAGSRCFWSLDTGTIESAPADFNPACRAVSMEFSVADPVIRFGRDSGSGGAHYPVSGASGALTRLPAIELGWTSYDHVSPSGEWLVVADLPRWGGNATGTRGIMSGRPSVGAWDAYSSAVSCVALADRSSLLTLHPDALLTFDPMRIDRFPVSGVVPNVLLGAGSADGARLVAINSDSLQVIDADGLHERLRIAHDGVNTRAVALSAVGDLLAILSASGELSMRSPLDGSVIARGQAPAEFASASPRCATGNDGSIAVTNGRGNVVLFTPSGSTLTESARTSLSGGAVTAIVAVPARKEFLVGMKDGGVHVVDESSLTVRVTLPSNGHEIGAMTPSFDGLRYFTASDDGSIRIWHAETGKELLTLSEERITAAPTAIFIEPNNERLVVGYANGAERVWDAVTWAERVRRRGKPEWPNTEPRLVPAETQAQ